jgi:hypothetical protein
MLKAFIFSTIFAFQMGWAADFFVLEEGLWFDSLDQTPVSVVVELKGLQTQEVKAFLDREFQGQQVEIKNDFDNGQAFVRIEGENFLYSDVIQLKRAIENMGASTAATSLVPEIPLAVRVCNLKGQNAFVSAVSGLPIETIDEIDALVEEGFDADDPLIFRYFLDNREETNPQEYAEFVECYGESVLSLIPANTYGRMPLFIPGESVVFHSRVFHKNSVLGKYNPGLINSIIVLALGDNKYIEGLFWEEYAPGAMPKTYLLSELIGHQPKVENLSKALSAVFPKGWVLKGVYESSSSLMIITDEVDVVQEWNAYKASDFEEFYKRTLSDMAGFDEDSIYETLQDHPNYLGWRINQYLNKPLKAIVQERMRINKEFRVDVIAGSVLPDATLDRHNWWLEKKGLPTVDSSPELMQKIDNYVQSSVIETLEPSLKETNFAFDIYLLTNGEQMIGESNPGSQCGFLIEEEDSIEALNEFLKTYPRLVKEKKIKGYGMTNEEQMQYLTKRFKKWEMDDPNIHYNMTFKFIQGGVEFLFKPIEVDEYYQIGAPTSGKPCKILGDIFQDDQALEMSLSSSS